MLREQVIKRDTLEGEQAQAASRRFTRRSERSINTRSARTEASSPPDEEEVVPPATGIAPTACDPGPRDAPGTP